MISDGNINAKLGKAVSRDLIFLNNVNMRIFDKKLVIFDENEN